MNHANMISEGIMGARRKRRAGFLRYGLVLASMLAASGLAQAQSTAPPADDSLTWKGITLYGIVDIGLQYQTHGAPISDYFVAGSADIVQKNSNHSIIGVTPSNLSQSRVGLNGKEALFDDWNAVFKLETFFNPQSGEISDACKSLALNNYPRTVASGTQTTNLDSSVCGQAFQQSFAGFSSKTFGTIVFGRQNSIVADGVAKYDPNAASQAFSLIGLSGTTAGGGDTQNRRFDNSVKYTNTFMDFLHVGTLYKFNNAYGSASTAWEHNLGFEYAGFSLDAYYSSIKDAVSLASLTTAAQIADLPALGDNPSNSLAATISDNTAFDFMASYNWDVLKFFAGYEHIRYGNPQHPLAANFNIAAYTIAFVNNTAYTENKVLQVYWAGIKWAFDPHIDFTAAWYGYKQNAYATGADYDCGSNISGACSGTTDDYSADVNWKMTKRFTSYVGLMYTGVHGGQANGYIFHTNDVAGTIGLRFTF